MKKWKTLYIEGDWAYVYSNQEPTAQGEENEEDIYGWIQWRKDDRLLIKYYLVY